MQLLCFQMLQFQTIGCPDIIDMNIILENQMLILITFVKKERYLKDKFCLNEQ